MIGIILSGIGLSCISAGCVTIIISLLVIQRRDRRSVTHGGLMLILAGLILSIIGHLILHNTLWIIACFVALIVVYYIEGLARQCLPPPPSRP